MEKDSTLHFYFLGKIVIQRARWCNTIEEETQLPKLKTIGFPWRVQLHHMRRKRVLSAAFLRICCCRNVPKGALEHVCAECLNSLNLIVVSILNFAEPTKQV